MSYKQLDPTIAQSLITENGDLTKLNDQQILTYYNHLCETLGLNPNTSPFQLLILGSGAKKRKILYATKDCTDQFRKIYGISVTDKITEFVGNMYIVTVKVKMLESKEERTDVASGVVPLEEEEKKWDGQRYNLTGNIKKLKAEDLANALMKAETKAKRRATLSICGLGMLDDSEIETFAAALKGEKTEIVAAPEPKASPEQENPGKPQETQQTSQKSIQQTVIDTLAAAIKEVEECKSTEELKIIWLKYRNFQADAKFKAAKDLKKIQLDNPVKATKKK